MSPKFVSEEVNKAVAKRWNEEGFNKHNIELIDECFHPDYTQRSGTDGPWSISLQGLSNAKVEFEKGFRENPTFRVAIEDMLAEGDKVALRVTAFSEGKPMANGNIIYRFADGKIMDDWFCWTMFQT